MSQKEQAYNTIKGLIERFSEQYASYKNSDYNETKTRRDFIDPFFHALGWDVDNSQGYAEGYREVIHEDAIKISGQTKAPDYSFRIGGQRIFFVEAKKPSVDIKIDISPAYQVRRYAWSAKLPVSILTDFEEFAVYDCRIMPKPNDSASTARIKYYTYKDYLEKWDEIYNLFSKEAVLKGKLNEYIESKTDKRGTQEVDDLFLQEMENWRDWLAHNINLRNPDFPIRTLNDVVQKTIDRIVFLRICEDRGIEPEGQLQKLLNGVNVYARLFEIFEAADRKYNSGLFHFASDKRNENPDTFSKDLKIDDKVLKDIIKRLYYPESPYVFSEIPADILGQVYERFIGKVITINPHHKAVIEQKPEVRKAGGVYYTPSYIVDYIVKNTLGKVLGTEDRTQNYEEINYSNTAQENALDNNPQSPAPKPLTIEEADKVTVLDPACGSGSFLLNAYQYLLDWYLLQYSKNPDKYLKGKDPKIYQIIPKNSIPNPQPQTPIYKLTIQEKKRILINHIYGVDIDPQAVEVTKLSLMLKVLEGETVETLNKVINIDYERALPDLSNNIKCGNSLIGSDFYEGKTIAAYTEDELYKVNAFDWEKEFPQIFKVDKGIRSVEQSPSIVQFGTQSKTQQETVVPPADSVEQSPSIVQFGTQSKTQPETVVPPAGSVEQSPSIVPYFPRKYNYSLLYDTIDTFITKQRDLPHWQLPGSVYFLTFRTFSNFELNEESRNIVYGAIHFNDNKKYKLYAFVVMSDHVHIILQPLEKAKNEFYNLSEILHGIKGYSAHKIKECILAQSETIVPPAGSVEQSPSIVQSYAQSEMIVPPVQRINTSKLRVWQHESFDRIIRNEEEFYEKMNYIANNPVKRGLVENIEEYKWFWFIGKDEDVNNRANAQSSIQSNAQPETVVPPSKSVEQSSSIVQSNAQSNAQPGTVVPPSKSVEQSSSIVQSNAQSKAQPGTVVPPDKLVEQSPSIVQMKSDNVNCGGFDVVIGNPPYGADLSLDERTYLEKKFKLQSTDTACLFMGLATTLLKNNGYNGFIVPKPFLYASNWIKIREKLLDNIQQIVDCSKVWKEVKLEQIIYIQQKNMHYNTYESYIRNDREMIYLSNIKKESCIKFGFYLNCVTLQELAIGEKMHDAGAFLNDFVENHRGAVYQKYITNEISDYKVLGGKQINRYFINSKIKGYISKDIIKDEKAFIKNNSILVQRIISHIQNPNPHIQIISSIADNISVKEYIIVDTINQLENSSNLNSKFLIAVINSKLISWYVYRFIFGMAIRTMQFDNPVTSKIPLPNPQSIDTRTHDRMVALVEQMIELNQKLHNSANLTDHERTITKRQIDATDEQIDRLVYQLYGLTDEEIAVVEGRG